MKHGAPTLWPRGWACGMLGLALGLAGCGQVTPQKEYEAGVAALHVGRLTQGKELLESALERDPAGTFAATAQNWLGLANWELGQTAEAMSNFEGAAKLNPAAFDPVYNLGVLALELGDPQRGIALLRRAADLDARDIRALLAIGEWTTRNGRWDLAKRMYFEVLRREPQTAAAATGLGRVALLEGQQAQAETFFMQALEMSKDYPPALYNLGVLYAQSSGHGEQAGEYFRQYLKVAAQGPRAAAASARIGGQAIEQDSFKVHAPAPQPKSAAAIMWAQARETLANGDKEEAYIQMLRALETAREGGDMSQTGEILKRALEVFGDRAMVQLEAGEYQLRLNHPAEAQAAMLKAQALEPDNPMVLFVLARTSLAAEEYDTAVISLRKLVQLEPGNADALWTLADVYGDKLGMISKGTAVFRDFERLFPSDPRVGEISARIKALEEAAAH